MYVYIIINIYLLLLRKCVCKLYTFNSIPKCSEVTKNDPKPCIYDGPSPKKFFQLISLSPNNSDDQNGKGQLNESNWNNAEKGHIHYMYRNEGPLGSLGVNNLSQHNPTHSSYCAKAENAGCESDNSSDTVNNTSLNKDYDTLNESPYLRSKRSNSKLLSSILDTLNLSTGHGHRTTESGNSSANNNDNSMPSYYTMNGTTNAHSIAPHVDKKCIAVPHLRHVQYALSIDVGTPPQSIYPIIDTGSTNTWVVSRKCMSDTCKSVKSFDSSLSSTFGSLGDDIRIRFGTGVIRGSLGLDNVKIGDDLVEKQVFGMVNEEISDTHKNVFKVINFQGIIGLAFPRLAFDHRTSLYDNYSKKIGADLTFSIYFSDNNSGLMIGGVDKRFCNSDVVMLPVVREYYWETKLKEIWVGDAKLCCTEESYVIFDSGTSFNTMPHDEFMEFKKLVSPKSCHDPVSPDDLEQFPTIKYVFDGGVELDIHPREYVFLHKNKCRIAYMQIDVPSSYGRAFILGTHAFMENYLTVYKRSTDNSPAMVGFAKSIPSDSLSEEVKRLFSQ
ncbi:pepsin A [Theileria orientalis]|uniref:Pepsin A n=1 Tax=Theileria orientalis TaxID=68886 RepID=A0A976QU40_THEOR|nr:pepsin A [Theileria orientalis]